MDFRDLKAGSTLYLPVFHPGALFYAGDPHGVQGDGEVSGNAIEQSLTRCVPLHGAQGQEARRSARRERRRTTS